MFINFPSFETARGPSAQEYMVLGCPKFFEITACPVEPIALQPESCDVTALRNASGEVEELLEPHASMLETSQLDTDPAKVRRVRSSGPKGG